MVGLAAACLEIIFSKMVETEIKYNLDSMNFNNNLKAHEYLDAICN